MTHQAGLSRELALAIGLAARALPDTQAKQLIDVLTLELGLPLTAQKLQLLSMEQYQQILIKGIQYAYPLEVLQISLSFLQTAVKQQCFVSITPVIQRYQIGDMPHSIRVAICSQNGLYIDEQFSACKHFYIYQISAQESRLIAIRCATTNEILKASQKQLYRAELIQDCQVLYSLAIGGAAASKVVKQGVHPIKLNNEARVADIIEQLQHVLLTSPPPFLAKTMGLNRSSPGYKQQEGKI